jgi:glycerophosphoryl diester phosphodiesterase
LSRDGEAVVFHDFDLARLTARSGEISAFKAAELRSMTLLGSADTIPTFSDLLQCVAGRSPIICEIKSRFDGDTRLADRMARLLKDGPYRVALKSFDPAIMARLRDNRRRIGITHVPLGMIAQAAYGNPRDEWAHLLTDEKRSLAQFLHWPATRPDFLSWGRRDLPHSTPLLCRAALAMPVITWTIRDPAQAKSALLWTDQIVFEGFNP